MTVQNLFCQLAIRDTSYEATFTGESDPDADFEFALCRNQITLGEIEIDQFWMSHASLYGQRNQSAINLDPLVDFWWAQCSHAGTQCETGVQESYLLAKLLPYARSNGSRRVFVDSFQTVPGNRSRRLRKWTEDLNGLLADSRDEGYDELAFQRATSDLIGPPAYPEEVWQHYRSLSAELFDEARNAIDNEGLEATKRVLRDWKRLFNSIGRRRGNPIEKQVLDVLSYESRAALHRCYSSVWDVLLNALGNPYRMTNESYIFHQLWHFDRCQESDHGDESYFHLFHGHVFGLHPACGPVLLTQCGGELFAKWLRDGTLQSYHRVLHALAVAVGYYADQYDIARLLRQGAGSTETVGDMVAVEEQETARRRGQRPRHVPEE